MMTRQEIIDYIRQSAQARNISPEIALRVASSEGLNKYVGDNGSSFGPFQLHYGNVAAGGNRVGGLGDVFTKTTGLNARDPSTIPQQIDFSLDQAAKGGWGPWHGWKGDANAGINGYADNGPTMAQNAPTQLPGAIQPNQHDVEGEAPQSLLSPVENDDEKNGARVTKIANSLLAPQQQGELYEAPQPLAPMEMPQAQAHLPDQNLLMKIRQRGLLG